MLAGVAPFASAATMTMKGMISDSMCGASHAKVMAAHPGTNILHFKHLLQVKERELLSEIAHLDEEARGSGEAEVRDSTDDATADQGTSESLDEGTVASQTLLQVQDALKHIEDGTYGKCIKCGKLIPARLEAVPWVAYCAEDQEKMDWATHAQTGGSTL